MSSVKVGDKAPDFDLPGDSGERVKLSGLKGKWVVLTFYAEDDTPVCTKQVCSFRDSHKDLEKEGALVLGVSPDRIETHKAWRAAEKIPFALLSDEGNKVATRYGAWGEKIMYGRPVVGVIRTTVVIGPNGRIAALQRKIRSDGSGTRATVALRAAKARSTALE